MNYTIFECGETIDSIRDGIEAGGHQLQRIVCRDPEAARAKFPHLRDAIVSSAAFTPHEGETYLCGLVGDAAAQWRESSEVNRQLSLSVLIHPAAIVSPTATIARGSIVFAGAIVASNVVIGEQCSIGPGTIFGHDTELGRYVRVDAGVNFAGHVRVGDRVIVEMGANIIEDVAIGDRACVRAGAVVLRAVAPNTSVAGIPARPEP